MIERRFPIGAEVSPDGVHFRVWSADRERVEVVIEGGETIALERESANAQSPEGQYFSGFASGVKAGARYRFRLDGAGLFPDPVSRFQPEGPHNASEVVDPSTFQWTDGAWAGAAVKGGVLYEMHIGTFTPEGTWNAARAQLSELAALGIDGVEVMPVADFPGCFGWGYDGVLWFAPYATYGTPDEFRAFVDEAHRNRIAVILDVVYNHVGPDGNYLKEFSRDYFTTKYANEWGEALNFDGPNSAGMRELVKTNAAYWAAEYHIDGLRLDATQQIFDDSASNIMKELADAARVAAGGRSVYIVAENEAQETRLVRAARDGGMGLDGLWNDDFHHSARVAVTGRREAYYTDYAGKPQELLSAVKYGYLYQGQRYKWQYKRRGTPALGLGREMFVTYIENHDQVANSGRGDRLSKMTSPGRLRAISAYMLLAPGTPMLFQGQEFASSKPFYFFADHHAELRPLVHTGRIQFLSQFPSLAQQSRGFFADPGDRATFENSKLDFGERQTHSGIYRMHKDLIRLRRENEALRALSIDGAVLGEHAFVLRYFPANGSDRILLVNLGGDLDLDIAPEPLLAPPASSLWTVEWSSEDPVYDGLGAAAPDGPRGWRLPAESAILMKPDGVNPWQ